MKNSSENKSFAVFIILSFLVYIMSNGEWCIPIFVWIYPILFLCLIYLNRIRKVYLIICSIYAIGFVVQFGRAIGMDIKICIMVSIEYIIYLVSYLYSGKRAWKSKAGIVYPLKMGYNCTENRNVWRTSIGRERYAKRKMYTH